MVNINLNYIKNKIKGKDWNTEEKELIFKTLGNWENELKKTLNCRYEESLRGKLKLLFQFYDAFCLSINNGLGYNKLAIIINKFNGEIKEYGQNGNVESNKGKN